MRSLRWGLAALFLVGALAGCVRLYKLSPVREDGVDRIFVAGEEVAVIEDDRARVTVSGAKVSGSEMRFRLSVLNKAADRFDVIPEEIRVTARKDGYEQPLKVWMPDKLLADRESAVYWSAFAGAVADSYTAADAGKKTVTTEHAGTATRVRSDGTVVKERTLEHETSVVRDPGAQAIVEEQQRQRREKEAADAKAATAEYAANLLKATTLFKGDKVEGLFVSEAQDSARYTVTLDLGNRRYRATFLPRE